MFWRLGSIGRSQRFQRAFCLGRLDCWFTALSIGLRIRSHARHVLGALAATALAGCAIHPIPDNVSPIPTENIVAQARCELRSGLVEKVAIWLFKDLGLPASDPLLEPELIAQNLKAAAKRYPSHIDLDDWDNWMRISVAYDWTFEISETTEADAGIGFRLPFINPTGTLDVGAAGRVSTLRRGTRTFKNQDTFVNLLSERRAALCHNHDNSYDEIPLELPRPKRPLYPMTGAIGLEKVAKSFLSIASWADGVDTFVDEIAFTTTLNASLSSTITLTPVPRQFRLVSAEANLGGGRVDLHKVKVSLAFPRARPAQPKSVKQLGKELEQTLEVAGGYRLNPNWRAAYALCVADARSREEDFKALRREPPEVTCVASTDTFFPRGDGRINSLRTGRVADLLQEQSQERQRQLEDRKRTDEIKQLEQRTR